MLDCLLLTWGCVLAMVVDRRVSYRRLDALGGVWGLPKFNEVLNYRSKLFSMSVRSLCTICKPCGRCVDVIVTKVRHGSRTVEGVVLLRTDGCHNVASKYSLHSTPRAAAGDVADPMSSVVC